MLDMKQKLMHMIEVEQLSGRTPTKIELSGDDEGELWTEQSSAETSSLPPAQAASVQSDGLRPHVKEFAGLPITYGHPATRIVCREDAA
jgi:hypothetical protein